MIRLSAARTKIPPPHPPLLPVLISVCRADTTEYTSNISDRVELPTFWFVANAARRFNDLQACPPLPSMLNQKAFEQVCE